MAINDDRTLRAILEKVELLTGERSDGSRRAVLISELNGLIQDLSDQNAVIKKSITSLESQMGESSAALTQELLTLASNNVALSQAITTLKAAMAGNLAEIQDTKRTIALSDMVMAENIQTLSSGIGSNSAQISEEKRTRATQDEALAQSITNLSATVTSNNNTLTAAIQTEQTARANGDAANASSINSLTSTVNGHTSSISSLQTATANISGELAATWAMTMTLDGSTGGMRLTGVKKADNSGATFNLILDTNVTINGNVLINGTLSYGAVDGATANRISNGGFAQSSGANNNIYVTVYCRAGAQVLVVATYDGGDGSSSGAQFFGSGGGGYWGELRTTVTDPNGGSTTIASQGINSFMTNVGVNFFLGTVDKNWSTAQTTAIGRFTASVTGNHTFYVRPYNNPSTPTYLGQLTKIAVFELAK